MADLVEHESAEAPAFHGEVQLWQPREMFWRSSWLHARKAGGVSGELMSFGMAGR